MHGVLGFCVGQPKRRVCCRALWFANDTWGVAHDNNRLALAPMLLTDRENVRGIGRATISTGDPIVYRVPSLVASCALGLYATFLQIVLGVARKRNWMFWYYVFSQPK